MVTFHILNKNFLNPRNYQLTIGGIQTYICSLTNLIKKTKNKIIVYQFSDHNFELEYDGFKVIGVNVGNGHNFKKQKEKLFKECMRRFNNQEDILLFACDSMIVKNDIQKSLAIQHGISWDVPISSKENNFWIQAFFFINALKAYRRISRIHQVNKLVCVDYNFVNWYRTQILHNRMHVVVIPNSTISHPNQNKPDGNIKIIFARRFVKVRGTRLFTEAIDKILKKYKNVEVTIAGEGPEWNYLNETFANNDKVTITKYHFEQSAEIHAKHHIAVIPTLGSEGTSLSLLEAMASGCAVIVTNVGGMTNIILDNYNGIIINPNESELTEALEKLIIDKELRIKLAKNAYQTVSQSFNKSLWDKRWERVLDEL